MRNPYIKIQNPSMQGSEIMLCIRKCNAQTNEPEAITQILSGNVTCGGMDALMNLEVLGWGIPDQRLIFAKVGHGDLLLQESDGLHVLINS